MPLADQSLAGNAWSWAPTTGHPLVSASVHIRYEGAFMFVLNAMSAGAVGVAGATGAVPVPVGAAVPDPRQVVVNVALIAPARSSENGADVRALPAATETGRGSGLAHWAGPPGDESTWVAVER